MGIIAKPNTFTAGATKSGEAAQINANYDTIYAEFNGNIEDANVKANAAIAQSKIASLANSLLYAAGLVAGTRMLFHQTAAPTGWTKDTTAGLNDNALRVVTGTVSSGGTVAFSTVMGTTRATTSDAAGAANTDASAPGSTDGFTLTTNEMPAHTHGVDGATSAAMASGATNVQTTNAGNSFTTSTGGGAAHAHTHTATHTHAHATTHSHTSNLNVLYQDVIIAAKA